MSKPILYTCVNSIWPAVPDLALLELGYAQDAIHKEVLNLVQGENFNPTFLKINPEGTVPAMTVDGKNYTNTTDVTEWLVKNSPNGAALVDKTNKGLIKRLHDDDADPNFALVLARSAEELGVKVAIADGLFVKFLKNRQAALEKYSSTPEGAEFADFYAKKKAANGGLLAIYEGTLPESAKSGFFQKSNDHWASIRTFILNELIEHLPESGFIGGDRPGEADFHAGAWLARMVATKGGKDINALSHDLGEHVPKKLAEYWAAWDSRDSWKTVYGARYF
ncbi:hypothetical protein BD410DRAFT_238221 [Rickenella mellea]|uniref:GST N-terminal domain-containing protein n=1 Tax=Rickenella mellea TaxID=50990 RepID=A0A4Y7QM18_9AGAM|nr:hypothetical protein BD410DRAFT_238221 [Rickenella mellea]